MFLGSWTWRYSNSLSEYLLIGSVSVDSKDIGLIQLRSKGSSSSPCRVMNRVDELVQTCLLRIRKRSRNLVPSVIIRICHRALVSYALNASSRGQSWKMGGWRGSTRYKSCEAAPSQIWNRSSFLTNGSNSLKRIQSMTVYVYRGGVFRVESREFALLLVEDKVEKVGAARSDVCCEGDPGT